MKNTIYFITGPTATGKSKFAIDLSKKIKGEIVNADSMQIYKELKIITARPSQLDNKKIKHHLYGYVDGSNRYNVEKWCQDASQVIKSLNKKNINPIFVGGTGLYIDTLINGIASIPSVPESIRNDSKNLLKKVGKEEFYKIVKKIDEDSIKLIFPNDIQRLRRIWEVFNYSNKKFSEWKKNKNKKFITSLDYKILLFLPDRKKNYERVNKRVLTMIKSGAIEEIENLLKFNYNKDLPIMRAHGVPEISAYLKNKITLEDCIKKIQLVTRHYVKRQNTWWNSSNLQIFKKITEFPDNLDKNLINLG